MNRLKNFIQWFVYITTGILIVTAISFTLLDDGSMDAMTLWQILLAGFLTTAVTVLFSPDEQTGKRALLIRMAGHYLCLCAVMVGCGIWFGWIRFTLGGVLMMFLDVAIVYSITFTIYWLLEKKNADELNRKLQEKYNSGE